MIHSGRHFLQIPGPTNVPDRVLKEIAQATIDHRGPEFADLGIEVLDRLKGVFRTRGPVVIFPSSGTGAAEAALANTLSPGDRILIFETGWFSHIAWRYVAERLGVVVEYVPGTWRRGASPETLEQRLKDDKNHDLKAVVVVHNETSTGVVSRIADLRRAMNRTGHPALLIVDAISSLASVDLRHDEWEIDVTVCGSQKALMLPPGLAIVAVSDKGWKANERANLPRFYADLGRERKNQDKGDTSFTPAVSLIMGLRESLRMLKEETLAGVWNRHERLAKATRAASGGLGLELFSSSPVNSVTGFRMPNGIDGSAVIKQMRTRYGITIAGGQDHLKGKIVRIAHLGYIFEFDIITAISGLEMTLSDLGFGIRPGAGVAAAQATFAETRRA